MKGPTGAWLVGMVISLTERDAGGESPALSPLSARSPGTFEGALQLGGDRLVLDRTLFHPDAPSERVDVFWLRGGTRVFIGRELWVSLGSTLMMRSTSYGDSRTLVGVDVAAGASTSHVAIRADLIPARWSLSSWSQSSKEYALLDMTAIVGGSLADGIDIFADAGWEQPAGTSCMMQQVIHTSLGAAFDARAFEGLLRVGYLDGSMWDETGFDVLTADLVGSIALGRGVHGTLSIGYRDSVDEYRWRAAPSFVAAIGVSYSMQDAAYVPPVRRIEPASPPGCGQ